MEPTSQRRPSISKNDASHIFTAEGQDSIFCSYWHADDIYASAIHRLQSLGIRRLYYALPLDLGELGIANSKRLFCDPIAGALPP